MRRTLERECEEMTEMIRRNNDFLQMMNAIDAVKQENSRLKDDNEDLCQQLNDEKQQRAELEMKLMEMSKLTTDMVKKASEENVLKALRTYVNRSKRKTADKRAFAKSATLEIANANGLDLPEDLKTSIESLDDETEATASVLVNVEAGGINVQQANSVNG